MAEPFKHIYKVDLNQPLKRFDVGDILASGDEKANSFEVTVCRDGANVDLSGCTVLAYFIRPNEETMTVDGTANGSKAIVEPSKNCYVYDGEFSLAIKLVGSGITQTVAVFDGRIVRTTSENIIDGDRVIYGLEDLLAQITTTEAAANSANTAADRANRAASGIENASASATTLKTGAAATVSVTDIDGGKHFAFGLPRGEKGEKGDPGTIENVTITSIAGLTEALAGKQPVGNYLAAGGTAVNASKLGGKTPEYYFRPRNLLDNSDWRKPVNQRGQTSYTGTGYTIDRWRKENEYTKPVVTVNNGYISLENTDTSYSFHFQQLFESGSLKIGETYTVAIKYTDGIVFAGSMVMPEKTSSSKSYAVDSTHGIQFGIGHGTECEVFTIYMPKSTSVNIEWLALYEGSYTADAMPSYMPKGYAAELLECQRYFVAYPTYADYSLPFAHGSATSATGARFDLALPVPMRVATPSIDATGVTWAVRSVATTSPANVSVLRAVGNKIFLTATVSSGLTNYQQATLAYYGTSGKTYYVCFSADL